MESGKARRFAKEKSVNDIVHLEDPKLQNDKALVFVNKKFNK